MFTQGRDATRRERAAGEPRIARGIHALREPKAHQQKLVRNLLRREDFIRLNENGLRSYDAIDAADDAALLPLLRQDASALAGWEQETAG